MQILNAHIKQSLTNISFLSFLLFVSTESGRYSILSTGELLIRNTTFSDAGLYRCQARHQLTDELRTSEEAGRLIVTGKFSFCLFVCLFAFFFLSFFMHLFYVQIDPLPNPFRSLSNFFRF